MWGARIGGGGERTKKYYGEAVDVNDRRETPLFKTVCKRYTLSDKR